MLTLKQTGLEELSFGDQAEDLFFVLINKLISPEGLDLEKLRLADPRNFDQILTEAGCILMLNQVEVDELARRGELSKEHLHSSLFDLAKQEGLF